MRSRSGGFQQKQNNKETDWEKHVVREFVHSPSDTQRKNPFSLTVVSNLYPKESLGAEPQRVSLPCQMCLLVVVMVLYVYLNQVVTFGIKKFAEKLPTTLAYSQYCWAFYWLVFGIRDPSSLLVIFLSLPWLLSVMGCDV